MSRLCGIDEAGRGPIAGDLVMAGCLLREDIAGLNDSKKLTQKRREALYEKIVASDASYHIVKFSAQTIDENGISHCLREGLKEILASIEADEYLFDGNTNFGVKNLTTMIKADGKVPEVSAASILAKVTHDRDILELAKEYPEYQLEKHKGYGTKLHIEMIKKYGYSPIHRKTYKIKALEATLF
jgi:ribonuclease HII